LLRVAKTDNNLPDPTLSYAHLWGAKDKSETIGELVVSQSFVTKHDNIQAKFFRL